MMHKSSYSLNETKVIESEHTMYSMISTNPIMTVLWKTQQAA